MNSVLLIVSLLLFGHYQKDQFDLRADMKKDEAMLADQHGVELDKSGLKEFKRYTDLDLSKFRFSKRASGKHHILKWTSTTGARLTIYEVKSIIPRDTVYQETLLEWDSVTKKPTTQPGEKIKLKPANFTFHTYIIQLASGKGLIYMTEQREGLMKYHVGKEVFYPVYEDIAVGLRKPDIKEILKLIATVK